MRRALTFILALGILAAYAQDPEPVILNDSGGYYSPFILLDPGITLLPYYAPDPPGSWGGFAWDIPEPPNFSPCDTGDYLVINLIAYGVGDLQFYNQVLESFYEVVLPLYDELEVKLLGNRAVCHITEVDRSTPSVSERLSRRNRINTEYLHFIRWRYFILKEDKDPPRHDIIYKVPYVKK